MIYVCAVNRSSKPLEALWDGRRYFLTPGDNALPETVALIAKRQNPRMGTASPYVADMCDSLIGIRERGDDCSPLEQSEAKELFDRKQLPLARQQAEVVPGVTGLYGRGSVAANQPLDSSFVDPSR